MTKSNKSKVNKIKKASEKASLSVPKKESQDLKTVKSPQTMDDLLKSYSFHGFKKGEVIEGTITEKSNKTIWVDIGGKTEGLILNKEIKTAKDYVSKLKVGDKVTVSVYQPENDKGYPLLSFRKTLNDFVWSDFDIKMKAANLLRFGVKKLIKAVW